MRRLNGLQVETSAVFNMATQFGGGKTHAPTTLYHLATTGPAKCFKGVETILAQAGVPSVPKAAVAVFVGGEFDALVGRSGDGEPTRKTPWGEIAWQLGGAQGFAAVAEHDAKGIAPAGDALRATLPPGPTLILMDELLNYFSRGRSERKGDQIYNFLQNLTEEARSRNDLVLCVSIPASETEMNQTDQRDYDALKKMLDRLGKAIVMSADAEMAEVIRRRLFEWDGLSDDARRTADASADWAAEHARELAGIDAETARERFRAAYPFHPSVLGVFERKWQSVPRFQKTRGVLRLLAPWVAHAYQEEYRKATRDPLVTLGTAPFENQFFRSALFEQMGSTDLVVPVTTDIAGKGDAHADRLDREAEEEVREARLHRKAAATRTRSTAGTSRSGAWTCQAGRR